MSTERFPFSNADTSSSSGYVPPSVPVEGAAPSGVSSGPRTDLLGRVVDSAHDTIDRLADSVAPHVAKLEGGVQDAGEVLHERADQLRNVGGEWAESVRCSVREHPLAAMGLALALGLVVARLTRR